MERLRTLWLEERQAAPLWAPVLIGLGVQIYFWLPAEPPGWTYSLVFAAPVLVWAIFWRRLSRYPLLGGALILLAVGLCLAGARARIVAAPVLPASIDATVEGTVREITRTATGRPRLVLDRLVIFGVGANATPERAQVSLLSERHLDGLRPGARVSIFARLGPPGGPVEPGGFDYRRNAWFKSLGAIGFARGAPAVIGDAGAPGLTRRLSIGLARFRAEISAGLRARLPGETGAFAAAVTVGDRAAVSREATEALRASNLAHLLAISGLHMGLVTALVFGAARLILAAIPHTARRWRTKRLAAIIALAAATGYLLISGASVATQRAYIMAVVALVAVIVNRPAITLRALGVAAILILVFRPESLVHVGFQMSFAATAAIIAGLDFARERGWTARLGEGGVGRRLAGYLLALTATSLLAGLATAPFAAFHFNRVANYGLIANLAAVPAMGFWVAPAALVAAALTPFGLEGWALQVMGRGIDAIMIAARFVAGLDGATRGVAAAPPVVLTLIALGGLGMCLGRWAFRWAGVALTVAGFLIWLGVDARPEALIAQDGRLMGVMGPDGRALDHAKAQSYAARNWLERDGDDANQEEAAARGGFAPGYEGSVATLSNGWKIANVLGRRPDPSGIEALCAPRVLILAPGASAAPSGPCRTLFGAGLSRLGALAIDADGDAVRIRTAAEEAGRRPWTLAAGGDESQTTGLATE
ncbi:ComEC family competence protein [Pikeienuella piscinae]|uniref:ComEC family competence protein n=1 Tax=Pikeienuella piscinae TaxID=2748098 RepID=A0A7L5C1P7_9RHOB|nr:ComEC/Rec2 family competence protein [Pikeienuella piscinae]QIE56074.1 ComEC family competence protein [Pikeienuella piscinae]